MRVIHFNDTANNLARIIDQAADDADYTVITRENSENAVVMSLDTFNSYMETFYLLKSPANATHIAESIEQYKAGQVQEKELYR